MLSAASHTEAVEYLAGVLAGVGTVHRPPIPTSPVAGPAVLVQTPQANGKAAVGGCRWTFEVSILVIAGNTVGSDLLPLTDAVAERLAAQGLNVTTFPQIYQPPNTPAALPAVLIKGA